jgi:hypothetical protein
MKEGYTELEEKNSCEIIQILLKLNATLNSRPCKSNSVSFLFVNSTGLLCSLASSSYSNVGNHLAIIEAWVIYIFSVLRHSELYKKDLGSVAFVEILYNLDDFLTIAFLIFNTLSNLKVSPSI